MNDCDRLQRYSSRIYFNPNSSELNLKVRNLIINEKFSEQLCEYKIKEGGYYENYKLVRSIRSNKNGYGYMDSQQCWASFKCPTDMHAYWRREQFYTERYYDQVRFYGVNNDQYRVYSGDLGWSSTWYTLFDNEITFEFKSDRDESSRYSGFELYLTCK